MRHLQPGRRLRPSAFSATGGRRRYGRALESDRGAVILEFTGFLPTLLLIGLACIQLGLVGYSFSQAGSGARAAARSASLDENAATAGTQAMSTWLNATVTETQGDRTVTAQVTVQIPDLVPFADMGWTATREVTMPMDDTTSTATGTDN